jgi:hypothetical protein
MTTRNTAKFLTKPVERVAVTVTRRSVAHGTEVTWIVTVKDASNVLLLRRFNSLDYALGFTAETLNCKIS